MHACDCLVNANILAHSKFKFAGTLSGRLESALLNYSVHSAHFFCMETIRKQTENKLTTETTTGDIDYVDLFDQPLATST